MNKLSEHLSLAEVMRSVTARAHGIDNTPPPKVVGALKILAENCFEPLRAAFGAPITISSGYRSPALNSLIGEASPTSQHLLGEALDMECSDNARLFWLAVEQGNFHRLIWEHGDDAQPDWIHISCKAQGNMGFVLRKFAGERGYRFWNKISHEWD
jgi:zinc D-Ala-D-Ala carboxypeptidase